jgi:adenylylsulfate kinase
MRNAGAIVWFTGLPASGKTTLADRLFRRLRDDRQSAVILDGDEVRELTVPEPGHDEAGRDGFYRTLAGMAALIARQGTIAIVSATAHLRTWRVHARSLVPRFIEVHVSTPIEDCIRRDPKGLYASGVPELPGVGVEYEAPLYPELIAPRGDDPYVIEAALALLALGVLTAA